MAAGCPDVMNSGQRDELLGRDSTVSNPGIPDPDNVRSKIQSPKFVQPTVPCSTRSAELLLVFLILISLNIVAAYDWVLSRILKVSRRFRTATTTFHSGFDTTHLSRSVARRVRPIE